MKNVFYVIEGLLVSMGLFCFTSDSEIMYVIGIGFWIAMYLVIQLEERLKRSKRVKKIMAAKSRKVKAA